MESISSANTAIIFCVSVLGAIQENYQDLWMESIGSANNVSIFCVRVLGAIQE